MPLIVDGYNVIFAVTHRRLRYDSGECESLRTELLERMEHYRRCTGEEITVVFDGGEKGAHLARRQHFGGLTVIFSDPGSSADEEIKQLVRESSGARELRVFTDDRSIAQQVRRCRAKVGSTEELLRKMEQAEERDGDERGGSEPSSKFDGPAPHEVEGWVDYFEGQVEEGLDEE